MTSSSDIDYNLKKAIFLLHSDDPQSATELRIMLDELIKQRYGPSKMLVNLVTPKHLELERSFPGVRTERPETEPEPMAVDTVDEVINLTNSPVKTISDSPDTIADSDDGALLTIPTNEEVENLKEFGDLNCCVCGEMMFTATNRLIECSQCGALYHQECHKPTITNEETCDEKERSWQCNNCNDKPSTSRAAAAAASTASAAIEQPIPLMAKTKSSASSSRSSSSSNSSSPFYKQEHSSSSSSKHHKSSSSSSKSQKEDRSGGSGSSSTRTSRVITPAINIVSAPEKSATPSSSSKSKTSSSHSSSSKSSSSKSSSKHHDSSKRKLGK